MIEKLFYLVAIAGLLGACQPKQENTDNQTNTAKTTEQKIQEEVPEIDIADFDAQAKNFVGKEVKVNGIVDHVCKHGGKKLLLVADSADIHVESKKRFDDAIVGNEVVVIGKVKEFKVDEAYCLKMEEDNLKSHSEGKSNDKLFEQKKKQIAAYRDSMEKAGVDHLSFYSLEFISLNEAKKSK
ncbi:MAG: hypothetical protein L3J74_18940 [Bacteroidales bacterium]|nr:hypothetical protein [Bacteroidales bacterium]